MVLKTLLSSTMCRYQEDVCAALLEMKPQELANVLWSLAVLNCKPNRVSIILSHSRAYGHITASCGHNNPFTVCEAFLLVAVARRTECTPAVARCQGSSLSAPQKPH